MTFALCLLVNLANAQTAITIPVSIRVASHGDFDRVVFEAPVSMIYRYSHDKELNTLEVTFDKKVKYNQENIEDISKMLMILAIDVYPDGKATIKTVPDTNVRVFGVGKKTVVDIHKTTKTKIKPKQSEPIISKTEEVLEPAQYTSIQENQKNISEEGQQTKPKKEEPQELKEPLIINVTSTEAMGLAVFERFGTLWIITDRPDMLSFPMIGGAEKDKVKPFDKIEMQGGSAFRTNMPPNANIYAEGGGLSWRLILTPENKSKKITEPTREYLPSQSGKGTLTWPFESKRTILTLEDPLVGDKIKVVTTESSNELSGSAKEYIDFRTYPSYVGMALLPLNETLSVEMIPSGVRISANGGLDIAPKEEMAMFKMNTEKEASYYEEEVKEDPNFTKIFDMKRWTMGGARKIEENQQALMIGMLKRNKTERIQSLITLGKLNLANGFAAEASGFLKVAENMEPDLNKNPEFLAIKGAAKSFNHQFDDAHVSLKNPILDRYDEIKYWRSYTLAGLEDWHQAGENLPESINTLQSYHPHVRGVVALVLAEVALRSARTGVAEKYLDIADNIPDFLNQGNQAYLNYLKGELYRQKVDTERTKKYWEPLTRGKDDLYRTKAGLALTKLQLEEKSITPAEAIDRMERLRYSWRGDDLEATVNKRLGEAYIQYGDYLKGLGILRSASAHFKDTLTGREMTKIMSETFKKVFMSKDKDEHLSPIDYITIFEEFKELTPAGEVGDELVQSLAEKMIAMDLIGRATELLQHQFEYRLKGKEAGEVGLKLASVYLIDSQPEKALSVIEQAEKKFAESGSSEEYLSKIAVLKAHANSKMGEPDYAMKFLTGIHENEDVLRLKADIAWQAGKWALVAKSLEALAKQKDIARKQDLSPQEAEIILNWAIALNLSENRPGLMSLQRQFGKPMSASGMASQFEVVTRERQRATLMSHQEMQNIVDEVDIFGDFIKSYHASPEDSSE